MRTVAQLAAGEALDEQVAVALGREDVQPWSSAPAATDALVEALGERGIAAEWQPSARGMMCSLHLLHTGRTVAIASALYEIPRGVDGSENAAEAAAALALCRAVLEAGGAMPNPVP